MNNNYDIDAYFTQIFLGKYTSKKSFDKEKNANKKEFKQINNPIKFLKGKKKQIQLIEIKEE